MRICLVFVLIAFALAPVSSAVTIKAGMQELILQGSLDFENYKNQLELDAFGGLGYYIADNLELGGFLAYRDVRFDSLWGIGVLGEYGIDLDPIFVPFFGARIGYYDGDEFDDEYFLLTLSAGIKYFLAQNVAAAASFEYSAATRDNAYQVDGDFPGQKVEEGARYSNSDMGIRLGVRCYF